MTTPKYNLNEWVFYKDSDCSNCLYQVMEIRIGNKIENSHYVFGKDINDFPVRNYYGLFEVILAEYSANKMFIKNIPCLFHQLEKIN